MKDDRALSLMVAIETALADKRYEVNMQVLLACLASNEHIYLFCFCMKGRTGSYGCLPSCNLQTQQAHAQTLIAPFLFA